MSDTNSVARDRLRSFVERIEHVNEEIENLKTDVKDIYAEAKGEGYDTKVLRAVISLRKKDQHEREEMEALLDVYLTALGMTTDFPDVD